MGSCGSSVDSVYRGRITHLHCDSLAMLLCSTVPCWEPPGWGAPHVAHDGQRPALWTLLTSPVWLHGRQSSRCPGVMRRKLDQNATGLLGCLAKSLVAPLCIHIPGSVNCAWLGPKLLRAFARPAVKGRNLCRVYIYHDSRAHGHERPGYF